MAKRAKKAKAKANSKRRDLHNTRIKFLAKDNPRRPKTEAGKRYAQAQAYMRKHPKATVKEVYANTEYASNDLQWDIDAKNVQLVHI